MKGPWAPLGGAQGRPSPGRLRNESVSPFLVAQTPGSQSSTFPSARAESQDIFCLLLCFVCFQKPLGPAQKPPICGEVCPHPPPAPPTGAGRLLPLTGRPAASLLTWLPAGLGSPLRCPPAGLRPSLYGHKLVPSCPPVGSRPFSPPTETGPLPSCLPVGVAWSALPSPGASS